MARKFSTPINLQQLELLNPRAQQLASDPSSGVSGQFYFNTSTLKWRLCTVTGSPGTWVDLLIGPVTSADITNGTIVDADINAAAAIAYSKLNLTGLIVNADIAAAAAIARSKLNFGSGLVDADIAAAAAIAESKLNLATDAAAGTGSRRTLGTGATQAAPGNHTLASHPTPVVALPMGGQLITGVADPVSAQDAATKNYVDGIAQGLDIKASVMLATTANVATIAGGAPSTLDGVALQPGIRILVKDQSTPAQNGIYTVTTVGTGANGTWARATDADAGGELSPGTFVWVEQGTVNADTGWVITSDASITIGSTSMTWTQFSGAGLIVAGNGLAKTGNTLDVNVDGSSIEINADILRVKAAGITNAMLAGSIDLTTKVTGALPIANGGTGQTTALLARSALGTPGKYSAGNSNIVAATPFTVTAATHGLGAGYNKIVQVVDQATGELVECDISTNNGTGDVTVTSAISFTGTIVIVG